MENTTYQKCPYCDAKLAERGIFCPACRKQARCKNCKELVEKDALGCVMCGDEINAIGAAPDTTVLNRSQENRNKIRFERKGKSITLDADITDISSAYFADAIGAIVTNGNVQLKGRQSRPLFLQKETQPHQVVMPIASSERANQQDAPVFDDGEIHEVLKKIFTFDNDELKLIDPRLKHSGKLDQAIRLTLLVVYTHELMDRPQIERAVLNSILIQAKLDNGHSRTWIANSDELIIKDNLVELSVPGREAVKAILTEIADSSIEIGKVNFSKPKAAKSSKKKKDGQKSEKNNSSDSKNSASKPSPMVMIQTLINEGFFNEKRKIKDIIQHCTTHKAQHYKNNDLSGPLGRSIKDNILKREKNKNDNQYEYYS